jgi:DNA-binding beta-propeller fold protein YncE
MKVVGTYPVGALPQHVTPAYDLRHLYVLNDEGNSLTVINPTTGRPTGTVSVADPYNMYFTPDGRHAIVVAERLSRLDFLDPQTWKMQRSVRVDCGGVDHADFTADGRYALFSCEFSGQLIVIDVAAEKPVATIDLGADAAPQDVKLSPDGRTFFVADMSRNGVWRISPRTWRVIGFLHTGRGAHGLYVSRDAKTLFVTDRGEGAISLVSFATDRVVRTWHLPGGGSPDMGNFSADGKVLWLSGRYNAVVYAIDAVTGRLLARIPVGRGPHGLCVWPQPGRYSLGHTGIMR